MLGLPILISLVSTLLQVGLSWRIAFQLRSEPLEPFKSFLRTAATAFFLDVGAHLTPGKTYGATHQVPDHLQRNNARINRISEPFENHANRLHRSEHARVRFDRRRRRSIRNTVHDDHRLHPFASENRL